MKSKLLLVIEPDKEVRYFLEDLLRSENFPVLSAANFEEGVNILGSFPVLPDLIITEVDIEKILISDPRLCEIPVILRVAENADQREHGKNIHVLEKPIKLHRLLTAIKSHLGK